MAAMFDTISRIAVLCQPNAGYGLRTYFLVCLATRIR
jgi:hypothetical protein